MPAPVLISGTYALIPHPEQAYFNSAQRPHTINSHRHQNLLTEFLEFVGYELYFCSYDDLNSIFARPDYACNAC
ncbi:hypothetical protein GCM10008922_09450 [Faecalicatena contorta]